LIIKNKFSLRWLICLFCRNADLVVGLSQLDAIRPLNNTPIRYFLKQYDDRTIGLSNVK
jgi:hypothetical protein